MESFDQYKDAELHEDFEEIDLYLEEYLSTEEILQEAGIEYETT